MSPLSVSVHTDAVPGEKEREEQARVSLCPLTSFQGETERDSEVIQNITWSIGSESGAGIHQDKLGEVKAGASLAYAQDKDVNIWKVPGERKIRFFFHEEMHKIVCHRSTPRDYKRETITG